MTFYYKVKPYYWDTDHVVMEVHIGRIPFFRKIYLVEKTDNSYKLVFSGDYYFYGHSAFFNLNVNHNELFLMENWDKEIADMLKSDAIRNVLIDENSDKIKNKKSLKMFDNLKTYKGKIKI